ncbi:uncharacterized protein J3D65DRAFT_46012 [Phyllosticta citribraziliensis]|uniref:Uncharacterized protein n=1 Tax=Phyllosticta citribraziliensis TaxID=989973 RepID=A0ABR1MAT9_9PEZI
MGDEASQTVRADESTHSGLAWLSVSPHPHLSHSPTTLLPRRPHPLALALALVLLPPWAVPSASPSPALDVASLLPQSTPSPYPLAPAPASAHFPFPLPFLVLSPLAPLHSACGLVFKTLSPKTSCSLQLPESAKTWLFYNLLATLFSYSPLHGVIS